MRPLLLVALLLALPAGAEEPAAGPGDVPPEAILADLPFLDFPEPHRVVVDLAPAGHSRPLRFLLDTGASHSIATPRAAAELGIRVRRVKTDPYRRKTVLGRDVHILVDTRSSDTASKTGWEYALLGGTFLHHYVLELDFAARRVRFLDPRKFEVPEAVEAEHEAVLPLKTPMNRPGVEIELNGRTVLVLIDTGAPPPLLVSGEVAEAVGLDDTAQAGLTVSGALGSTAAEIRVLDELAIGPFEFEDLPTLVNPRGFFNQGMPGDSVIGYELLAQFERVRIDYPRRRLWLRHDPEAVPTFGGQPFGALDDPFAFETPDAPSE